MRVDWSEIPLKYKYVAQDADGCIFAYQNKPRVLGAIYAGSDMKDVFKVSMWNVRNPNWKESLVERPVFDEVEMLEKRCEILQKLNSDLMRSLHPTILTDEITMALKPIVDYVEMRTKQPLRSRCQCGRAFHIINDAELKFSDLQKVVELLRKWAKK